MNIEKDSLVVTPSGYINKSHCGYCGRDDSSSMFGMVASEMTVDAYQKLIDRGFRRSGTFIYKPDQKNSCCVMYTVRLDVGKYKPTKEQRQVANRFKHAYNSAEHDTHSKKHKGKDNAFNLEMWARPGSDKLRIVLDSSASTKEKFELYKKYQVQVHNDKEDDVSERQFKRFLCDNPFIDTTEPSDANPRGHFHQLYYWEEKLFAIGVIDILPRCVSSVYFIWDPSWAKWSLGKIGSLYEIVLAEKLRLPYYYMGYYIHDCPKMKYKGLYRPSYLLDPWFTLDSPKENHSDKCAVDGVWFNIEMLEKELDQRKLVSMLQPDTSYDGQGHPDSLVNAKMPGVIDKEDAEKIDIESMPVLFKIANKKVILTPALFQGSSIRNAFRDVVMAVGIELGRRVVLDMTPYA